LQKNALFCNIRESFKKFLHPNREADELVFSQLWSDVHKDLIISFHVKLLTDKRWVKRNLLGGGNNK